MRLLSKHQVQALAIVLVFVGSGYLGLNASVSASSAEGGSLSLRAQEKKEKSSRVILEHSDLLTYDAKLQKNVQKLIGNVRFRHENATMTCDSAYLNDAEQTFEAFGNVHMIQGDTINIYARYLEYDGRTRLAKLRHEVKLENTTTTVFTDSLDYDRVSDVAYYFSGGTVTDAQNTLSSDYGQFEPRTSDAEFRYNVRLHNDSTEMTTDHLFYNTKTRIARYNGESVIKGDSGTIYSSRGVYDLEQNVGVLLDRSEVYSGARRLVGDSIYYDGKTRFGEAFGQMEIHDTAQRASLFGDYGYFDGERNYAFTTSRAYALDYSQRDTSYIGADTLELISIVRDMMPDSLGRTPQDSMVRYLRAYHRVKVFHPDMQAIADSMSFATTDSVLHLYGRPIMWNERRQLTGDTTLIYFRNQKIDFADVRSNVFATEQMQDNESYYNQLKGTNLRAYLQDSVVRQIDVTDGAVESIFYMKEEKSEDYTGMNRMLSRDMYITLDSGQIKKVLWKGEVKAKVYPIEMSERENANRLEGFLWEAERRPTDPTDVISIDSTQQDYSLSALRRYSGARAARVIYTPYDEERKARQAERDSIAALPDMHNYQYILLPPPQTSTTATQRRLEQLLSLQWLYNHSLSPAVSEPSSTNTSIGMPARKLSNGEKNASATSLSPVER